MKRSRMISLGLLLGGSVLTFYACREPDAQSVLAFGGDRADALKQCVSSGVAAGSCQEAYAEAERAHLQRAPRFTSKAECERATDSTCDFTTMRRPDGTFGDVVVPVMTGFILARAVSGGFTSTAGIAMYRSLGDPSAYRPLGAFTGIGTGGAAGTPGPAASAKSISASRGGFGVHGGGRAGS